MKKIEVFGLLMEKEEYLGQKDPPSNNPIVKR